MDAYWLDWLELVLRWAHVIFAIAWIGTSFFFMWLDASLEPPAADADREVGGESWLVHSGGFYRMQKCRLVPAPILRGLHWFKWDAYLTWITGALLLTVLYYVGAPTYLVPVGGPIGPWGGVAVGVAVLVVGWLVYDRACRAGWLDDGRVATAAGLVGVGALAWGLTQLFTGRAAYLHVGAMLGTLMAANVAMVIMPAQRALVAATARGERPDPALGEKAKQRSVHNNYVTLPVVLIMLSNHYPMTYGHAWSWAILVALVAIGAVVRHAFNLHDAGRARAAVWIPPAAVVALVALAFVSQPRTASAPAEAEAEAEAEAVRFAEVEAVMQARCVACHAAEPGFNGFVEAPLGVELETPADIRRHADGIYTQSVLSDAMPLGNLTGITPQERALLGRWYESGAAVDTAAR
ncbi:MAG: urate hydroxylase PuuD [Alphaproteobacteria bacterium]